jgi:hypothetical protein
VSLILERIRTDKPLIANIVERADSTDLRDDTLFLTFHEASGIFRARLRDRKAMAAIEKAAEAALGRKIKVTAQFDGEAEGANSSGPEAQPTVAAGDTAAAEGAAEQERKELWERAEGEPLVQRFVDALRGNLTDVEDL